MIHYGLAESGERSSLLRLIICYCRKNFYSTNPRRQPGRKRSIFAKKSQMQNTQLLETEKTERKDVNPENLFDVHSKK